MKKFYLLFTFVMLIVFSACSNQVSRSIESSILGVSNVKRVRILNNQANVRVGVSTNSPVLRQVNQNTPLEVINQISNVYAVRLPNNDIGFIPVNQCGTVSSDNTILSNTTTNGNSPNGNMRPETTTNVGTNTPPTRTPTTTTTPNTPPTTTTPNGALTSDEQQMVDLVNSARSQNNLKPLAVDTALANVARTKAQDMIDKNYFDHTSPTYGSPFDMMKNFGINFTAAGENIAGNQTVDASHRALMNSPGHRANILNANFTHVGIGIRNGGTYGKMFSQMFITK